MPIWKHLGIKSKAFHCTIEFDLTERGDIMNGETHVTIGLAATTTMMAYGIMQPEILPLCAAALGSLLPDIDHDRGGINARLGINKGAYVLLAAGILYYRRDVVTIVIAAILLVIGFSRHRAITHSLIALIALYLGTYNIDTAIRLGLIVGYGSHLISDFFTKQGIELLYPNKNNYKAPITITTGKAGEWVVASLVSVGLVLNIMKIVPRLF